MTLCIVEDLLAKLMSSFVSARIKLVRWKEAYGFFIDGSFALADQHSWAFCIHQHASAVLPAL